MARIDVDGERCKACGLCVAACPQAVLAMGEETNSKGYAYVRVAAPVLCFGCRMCAMACPDTAITLRQAGTVYHYFDT